MEATIASWQNLQVILEWRIDKSVDIKRGIKSLLGCNLVSLCWIKAPYLKETSSSSLSDTWLQ